MRFHKLLLGASQADRSLRKNPDIRVDRIRSDIKNLNLEGIPELSLPKAKWVGCGKHLCGAATDYTIRACLAWLESKPKQSELNAENGKCCDNSRMQGFSVATCCHHRCNWRSFTGKEYFRNEGFLPYQFELISWMTGMANFEGQVRSIRFVLRAFNPSSIKVHAQL